MSSVPPTYYPPNTVIPTFNPNSFNDATVVSGYTTAQSADLIAKILVNQNLINSVNNKLSNLGKIITNIAFPTVTAIPSNVLTPVYSVALPPGVYLCNYCILVTQYPAYDATYNASQFIVTIPNSQIGSGNPYNILYLPFIGNGNMTDNALNGSCYIYITTAQTITINLKVIPGLTSATGTNQWTTGITTNTYPPYMPTLPLTLQITQILSL